MCNIIYILFQSIILNFKSCFKEVTEVKVKISAFQLLNLYYKEVK